MIIVTQTTKDLLAAQATGGRLSEEGCTRLPDGRWEVPLDEDLIETLSTIDPDPDTAIRQILASGGKRQ